MRTELCKRHNVDHTGTWCGQCVEIWQRHSIELKKLKRKLRRSNENTNEGEVLHKPRHPSVTATTRTKLSAISKKSKRRIRRTRAS